MPNRRMSPRGDLSGKQHSLLTNHPFAPGSLVAAGLRNGGERSGFTLCAATEVWEIAADEQVGREPG